MKKWRCKICDYIHVGEEPPETCPLCGAAAEFFELVEDAVEISSVDYDRLQRTLLAVPCGLFIVGSCTTDGSRVNAMVNNTVFQITNSPLQVVLGMDKKHWTTALIEESNVFSVNLLTTQQLFYIKTFGFASGRDCDKFVGIDWESGVTGVPILRDCAGYFECRVEAGKTLDAGTHLVFLANVVDGQIKTDSPILTYQEYRLRKQELRN